MKGEKEGKGSEESEKGEGRKGQMKKCKRSRKCTHSVPEKKVLHMYVMKACMKVCILSHPPKLRPAVAGQSL